MPDTSIAVVIPVGAQRLNNLRMVLASLEAQTLAPSEVIIVNDGEQSDLRAWASSHFDRPTYKYIEQPKFERDLVEIDGSGAVKLLRRGVADHPRNVGAALAASDFLVFLDSDVALHPNSIARYHEQFTIDYKDGIVCGAYNWLPPMQVSEEEMIADFDRFVEARFPLLPYPEGQPSHNVLPDPRVQFDEKQPNEWTYDDMACALACFGGNIGVSKKVFRQLGEFERWLSAGLVDDGPFGIKAVLHGTPIKFDRRIIGGHIYHPRDLAYVKKQSAVEMQLIDRYYHLGPWDDGTVKPDLAETYARITEPYRKTWAS